MNAVLLVGRIASDITTERYQRPGGEVLIKARFLFAVRPQVKGSKSESHWMYVEAWNVQAQNLARFNGKGCRIGVQGHIKGEWYAPAGTDRKELRVSVVADRVEFLTTKDEAERLQAKWRAPEDDGAATPAPRRAGAASR